MRSARLGPELEARLKRAASASGQPASQIIREGVEERVSLILGDTLAKRLSPYIGKVAGSRRLSAKDHEHELAAILGDKTTRRRRKAAG